MAKFNLAPKVSFEIQLTLTESEARALDALAGYGVDEFIRVFYTRLGRAYMEPHEQGLRAFLADVREKIPPQLGRVDKARKAFQE